jgi:hypothetical protein
MIAGALNVNHNYVGVLIASHLEVRLASCSSKPLTHRNALGMAVAACLQLWNTIHSLPSQGLSKLRRHLSGYTTEICL